MVSEELLLRLNDREYKNWLKAGRCLLILKSGLHSFTSQHMRGFHKDLLTHSPLLGRPCETNACRGNQVGPACHVLSTAASKCHWMILWLYSCFSLWTQVTFTQRELSPGSGNLYRNQGLNKALFTLQNKILTQGGSTLRKYEITTCFCQL